MDEFCRADYLAWVKGAQAVVGTDSSALHIAAGFDVSTLAVFFSIDPALPMRACLRCHALDISTLAARWLHANDDPQLLSGVHATWRDLMARATLPWPDIPASTRSSRLPAKHGWRSPDRVGP